MKKIMFNDEYGLTLSVLQKTKTQTRRIVPKSVLQKADEYRVEYYNGTLDAISLIQAVHQLYFVEKCLSLPYSVGETVAIAQKYKDLISKRDGVEEALGLYKIGDKFLTKDEMGAGFSNKMFVSADLMQKHIVIKDCRIEHLQDISDEDCMKEGIEHAIISVYDPKTGQKGDFAYKRTKLEGGVFSVNYKVCLTPQEAYAALIDKVSGKGTWDSNPIVLVYDFELID